jgi:hypothetical protein
VKKENIGQLEYDFVLGHCGENKGCVRVRPRLNGFVDLNVCFMNIERMLRVIHLPPLLANLFISCGYLKFEKRFEKRRAVRSSLVVYNSQRERHTNTEASISRSEIDRTKHTTPQTMPYRHSCHTDGNSVHQSVVGAFVGRACYAEAAA